MHTSLVIMAAGIGSRFNGGIKQLEPIGKCNEVLMDYSIHDSIEAGFNKIIIVIRRDIKKDFHEKIGYRIEAICSRLNISIVYVFQEINDLSSNFGVPEGRTKPWGTGHAVLAAKKFIDGPFAVINADDYYGKKAFSKIYNYLQERHSGIECCMVGFILDNTLSDNGPVTRGICTVENGMLTDIIETPGIEKTIDGARVNGTPVDSNSVVFMNMWGFPSSNATQPQYIQLLEEGFKDFFRSKLLQNPYDAEFLLPTHIGELLKEGRLSVKVLRTDERWFGITYKEDKATAVENFKRLAAEKVYLTDLYSDLSR